MQVSCWLVPREGSGGLNQDLGAQRLLQVGKDGRWQRPLVSLPPPSPGVLAGLRPKPEEAFCTLPPPATAVTSGLVTLPRRALPEAFLFLPGPKG